MSARTKCKSGPCRLSYGAHKLFLPTPSAYSRWNCVKPHDNMEPTETQSYPLTISLRELQYAKPSELHGTIKFLARNPLETIRWRIL